MKAGWRKFKDERALLVFAGGGMALFLAQQRGAGTTAIVGFSVGLIFGLLLLFGMRGAPAAFAAMICMFSLARSPTLRQITTTVPLALLYAGVYGACATVLRNRAGKSGLLSDIPGLVRFVAGAMVAALVFVLAAGLLLPWLGIRLGGELNARVWASYYLSQSAREATGILVMAPLVVLLFGPGLQAWIGSTGKDLSIEKWRPSRVQLAEVVGLTLGVGFVLGVCILIRQQYGISAFYLAFLPVLMPVARYGLAMTSVALACSSMVATWLWAWLGWDSVLPATDLRILLLVFAVTALVLAAFVDARKRARDDLASLAVELRALAARTEATREEERTRIAREIHDELGQCLTGMKMGLSALARRQAMDEHRERLLGLARDVDGIIQTVRRIATELRPGVLDALGLPAAVEWLASDFQKRTGIVCHVSCVEGVSIGRDCTTALFRILQESLTNVTRHAMAHSVTVLLEKAGEQVRLIVEDDGCGVPPERLHGRLSLGLLGMRERASQFGGNVVVERRPTGGTRVTAYIPLAAAGTGT